MGRANPNRASNSLHLKFNPKVYFLVALKNDQLDQNRSILFLIFVNHELVHLIYDVQDCFDQVIGPKPPISIVICFVLFVVFYVI